MARENHFDMVILDLMLPKLSGLDVLKKMRGEGVQTPVLILTARGQESDRVEGLELGADDYVVKPFSVRELVARVSAHLRRREVDAGVDKTVQLGEVEFDFARREVRVGGRMIPALPKEIDLARFLIENRGRVVTRDELLLKVWEYPIAGLQTRTVDNYVMKLRQKVEPDPARPRSHPHGARKGLPACRRRVAHSYLLVRVVGRGSGWRGGLLRRHRTRDANAIDAHRAGAAGHGRHRADQVRDRLVVARSRSSTARR